MAKSKDPKFTKGRAVSRLLETFGWVVCLFGLALALTGLWSMAAPVATLAAYGILAGLTLVVLGVITIATGLMSVQSALTARATFHTAEDTRALLKQQHTSTPTVQAPGLRAEPSISRPTPVRSAS
jgi:hypothetical protein